MFMGATEPSSYTGVVESVGPLSPNGNGQEIVAASGRIRFWSFLGAATPFVVGMKITVDACPPREFPEQYSFRVTDDSGLLVVGANGDAIATNACLPAGLALSMVPLGCGFASGVANNLLAYGLRVGTGSASTILTNENEGRVELAGRGYRALFSGGATTTLAIGDPTFGAELTLVRSAQ